MVRTLKLEKSQIFLLEIEKFNKPKNNSKVSAFVVKFQLSPDRCMLHGKKIIPRSQNQSLYQGRISIILGSTDLELNV